MIVADRTPWNVQDDGMVERLRAAYEGMTSNEVPSELSRVAGCLDRPDPRQRPGARLALVAEADIAHRSLATALLEETELGVIECASAEAALAVLVREADKTVFLLADRDLAGERDADALASTVRLLWPKIHVAVATRDDGEERQLDADGVVRLSRPWRGIDVLVEAERALCHAAA